MELNNSLNFTTNRLGNVIPRVTSFTCEEIDEMGDHMRGWGLDMTQLSRGRFQGKLTVIDQGDLQISQIQVCQAIRALGAKPSDSWVFAVHLVPLPQLTYAHDVALLSNCIFGFDDQREVALATTSQGLHLGCIVVSKALFQSYADNAGCYELDEASMRRNVVVSAPERFTSLTCYLQQLFQVSQQQPEFVRNSLNAQLIEKTLLPLLIDALRSSDPDVRLRSYRRADIVKAAQSFMDANLQHPLTLDDICQAVSASQRSVHYGFRDMFGMGPMAFLKKLRLNAIYRILLDAEPKSLKIAQIAQTWGFWSLGHFSRDYKELFGESPSQTLARSRA